MLVVLANSHAVGRARLLHGRGDAREGHHQRPGELVVNVVDLRNVSSRQNEHMALVARLLTQAWEYRRVVIAKRENFRVRLTARDAAEHAVCRRFDWYLFHVAPARAWHC